MGKQTGLGAGFWLDGYDLSGDIGSLSRINSARNVNEVTGIDVSAFERVHSHRDGGMEFNAWMNKASGQAMPVLKTVPSTDRIASYLHRKSTIGAPAAACVGKQISYDPTRDTDASLSWTVTVESNGYGVEWGQLLTAGKRTDTSATNGAAVDMEGAATSFGLQAYLHVFSFTGTDATVKLQMDDNSGFTSATDVTGGAFTQITSGPQAQRIQTGRALAVERYLRVVTTTSGGFSNLVFGVIVVRNTVSTNF
jgi:hypothetical protein